MSSINEFDMYNISDEEWARNAFENFKKLYPSYLNTLNNHIKLLYDTYTLVCAGNFSKLSKQPDCYALAQRIGFGMLMRHALEAISASITTGIGIEVGGRSVFERLVALRGQNIPDYDSHKETILFQALDLTNEIAHPHVINEHNTTFEDMTSFYETYFKDLITSHISHNQNLYSNPIKKLFDFKNTTKIRRLTNKYLLALKEQMDNFSINNKITATLIRGCLVRHLTECTANLWCYNYNLIPTDVSTAENPINLGTVLLFLSQIANANRTTAFGSSALTADVVSNLYDLKNGSNCLMHVDVFKIKNIYNLGMNIVELHPIVETECSPFVMEKKLAENSGMVTAHQSKPAIITTLLCGFAGWLGLHHFYAGNTAKGIAFLLTGGFLIGPILSLNKIRNGEFHSAKWGNFRATRLTSFLSVFFIILHIFLIYKFIKLF